MGGLGNLQPPEVVLLPGGSGVVVPGVPPQLGLHPGRQLQRVEGLCDVVVRPQGQTGDLVHILYPGGEHDDGKQVVLPDPLAQGKAVHVGEHDVQDSQIGRILLHMGQSRGRRPEFMDGKALIGQVDLHQVGNGPLVVHHQDLLGHTGIPSEKLVKAV